MNRIEEVFLKLKKENKKALIPYVSSGDPDIEFTEDLVMKLVEKGADIIELGIPFSDPVADGPTIQKASLRALKGGITQDKIFSLVKRLREKTNIPLILMTYFNSIYVKGIENFVKEAKEAGIDGIIVPDLPIEEAGVLNKVAFTNGIYLINLVAPTSTEERIQKIANISHGFIYCVSSLGVTGNKKVDFKHIEDFLQRIRKETSLPLAVGFGISNKDDAKECAKGADGVIVGSALIKIIEDNIIEDELERENALKEAGAFIKELKDNI